MSNFLLSIQFITAAAAFLCGLWWIIRDFSLAGFSAFLLGVYFSAWVALLPKSLEATLDKRPLVLLSGGIVALVGFASILNGSFVLDTCYMRTNALLLSQFSMAEIGARPPLRAEEAKLAKMGTMSCAIEPNMELLRLHNSLLEQYHTGPLSSFALNVANWNKETTRSICIEVYKQLKSKRPDLFISHHNELQCLDEIRD